ncbi:HD-GYP domain-containing protein [Azohydromonas lata]|uniref:HD-GYP domain-containing protein n=1 Tax=Azohydromonas lata TaxID=45677 RepID=UPI00082CF4B5|nr:HD domain-containing phosphohydrolase [Azohydromonas lata]
MNDGHLLILDDSPVQRAALREALGGEHRLEFFRGIADAAAVARRQAPALIVLDVEKAESDPAAACRALWADAATADIPVVLFTRHGGPGSRAAARQAGAADFIAKPATVQALRARVRLQLELAQPAEQGGESARRELLGLVAQSNRQRDAESQLHPWRMAAYAAELARAAGWDEGGCALLEAAAALHDVGELDIPDGILLKPLKLDADEWDAVRTHCRAGHALLSRRAAPAFQLAATIALHHHERWDGGGYPAGLAGNAIPEAARIAAVADAFDALTSRRPWRKAWSVDAAMTTLRLDAGTHLDPCLVSLFENALPRIMELRTAWAL